MKMESMFCGRCNGSGIIDRISKSGTGSTSGVRIQGVDCPNCDGTGVLIAVSPKNYRLMKHLIHTQNRELELNERSEISNNRL